MNRKSQKEIQVTTHMVRQFLQENEDTGIGIFTAIFCRVWIMLWESDFRCCENLQSSFLVWTGRNGLNRRMTSGMKKRCFADW